MRASASTFLLLNLLLAGIAPAADSLNVRLVGFYDTPGEAWDVAVVGDTAYVVEEGALRVISVADPAHPVEVGHCDVPGWARGVAVVGDLACVADCDSHVRVISVANPANPVEVGYCGTPDYAIAIAVGGDYAYVAEASSGLRVISVADSSHPVEIGYLDTPHWAYDVVVSGDYAYVADCDGGMRIISVADPAHPVEVGFYDTPGWAEGVAVSGEYAYVADAGALRVISVADPAHPLEVGHLDSLFYAPQRVEVTGGLAFVASWGGLQVISVADPSHPVEVGYYYRDTLVDFRLNAVTLVYRQGTLRGLRPDYGYLAGYRGLYIFQFYGAGVEETPHRPTGAVEANAATVVRGVLMMPGANGAWRKANDVLLDAAGRMVMELRPGANDVSRLMPGVYFVREEPQATIHKPQAVRKVIITR